MSSFIIWSQIVRVHCLIRIYFVLFLPFAWLNTIFLCVWHLVCFVFLCFCFFAFCCGSLSHSYVTFHQDKTSWFCCWQWLCELCATVVLNSFQHLPFHVPILFGWFYLWRCRSCECLSIYTACCLYSQCVFAKLTLIAFPPIVFHFHRFKRIYRRRNKNNFSMGIIRKQQLGTWKINHHNINCAPHTPHKIEFQLKFYLGRWFNSLWCERKKTNSRITREKEAKKKTE